MPDVKIKLIALLKRTAQLLELKGANPFRSRAYENAARALEGLEGDPDQWIAEGRLAGVRGIGKGMVEHIEQFVRTGSFELHEELTSEIPAGLMEMLHIPGMGAKKVKALWKELGIESIEQLEEAARGEELAALAGFGKKTAEKILAGIEMRRKYSGRHLLGEARGVAVTVLEQLRSLKSVKRIELAGSYRRSRETIKDLDFVVDSSRPEEVMDAFVTAPGVERVLNHGATKSSVLFAGGIPIDLRVVAADQFGPALNYFTGAKEHNTRLRGRAKRMGLRLNEYGLFKDGAEKPLSCPDEAAIYERLDLEYIEPELREDRGEIEAAEERKLPRLIQCEQMRGVLHCHSTYSDGKSTLQEMADAARAAGYDYFGICDHSQAAAYAGGLKEEDVARQHEEIDRLNAGYEDFRILKGIESDILGEGELDYPDSVLARFDFVVASVHSRFQMSRKEMTRRICRAVAHPATTILGHPTGRLLLRRDPYEVDLEEVFVEAARHSVALEINANPHRLDLDWRELKSAKAVGCIFTINPDAHHVSGFGNIPFGVGIARKGWLGPEDVINAMGLDDFSAWLEGRGQPCSHPPRIRF